MTQHYLWLTSVVAVEPAPVFLMKRPRFHVHFTPTSASWINLVERWFATLTEKQIRRGTHRSVRQLEVAIKAYLEITNESPHPFVWARLPTRFWRRSLDFVRELRSQDTNAVTA